MALSQSKIDALAASIVRDFNAGKLGSTESVSKARSEFRTQLRDGFESAVKAQAAKVSWRESSPIVAFLSSGAGVSKAKVHLEPLPGVNARIKKLAKNSRTDVTPVDADGNVTQYEGAGGFLEFIRGGRKKA